MKQITLILSCVCLLFFSCLVLMSYNFITPNIVFGAFAELCTIPLIILFIILLGYSLIKLYFEDKPLKSMYFISTLIFLATMVLVVAVTILTRNEFRTQMVYVEGGTFTMGCTPEQLNECRDNEKPEREITLSNFLIGKVEVTQSQWVKVMGQDKNRPRSQDSLPVVMVSWNDIQEFIKRINEKTGMNYRLPTEAEWEYAARGGNKSRGYGYKYSGSNNVDEIAWYFDNSGGEVHPVGKKRGNELSIYDMSGNAEEWVDWIGDYGNDPQTNPQGAALGQSPVSRGGGARSGAADLRVSSRNDANTPPEFSNKYLGFRLARSIE